MIKNFNDFIFEDLYISDSKKEPKTSATLVNLALSLSEFKICEHNLNNFEL